MFIDARTVPEDTEIVADVCIVGAGAAGITLARELAGHGFKVCLLESGGRDFEQATQDLYGGETDGFPHDLDINRLRYLGGTTNHWAGNCRPLEPEDFEVRPWIPHSGWPIRRTDLDPFYARAHPILELDQYDYSLSTWDSYMPEFFHLPLFGERLVPAIWQKSPPVRFGTEYAADLEQGDNLQTYLHANVIDIECDDSASTVTRLHVACLDGRRFQVSGKLFIVATGGIENPRLLLAANKVQTAGLGNGNDLVGRYFMEHPSFEAARIMLNEPTDTAATPLKAVGRIATRIMLSAKTAAEEGISQFSSGVQPTGADETRGPGYYALRRLTKKIRNGEMPDDLWGDLGIVLSDIGGLIGDLQEKFGDVSELSLVHDGEQVPNPDSRVMLIDERDALGMPRVQLQWRFTQQDKYSLRRAIEIIGEEFGRTGMGRVQAHEWVLNDDLGNDHPVEGRHHHMGTTRMSDDPKTGVVDKNCRVHGISNLFIAGSSVFPVGGVATPTLTIVALALRLADHIKAEMS